MKAIMRDENDLTRLAMSLDAIRDTLLDGTHGVFACSDSVTVKTDTWVQVVIELRRAQKRCAAYGETTGWSCWRAKHNRRKHERN